MAARGITEPVWTRQTFLARAFAVVCLLVAGSHAVVRGQGREHPNTVGRQEAIEDVDFLLGRLCEKHPDPFVRIPEAKFRQAVAQLKESLPERVKIREFSLSIAALLALVGDDHTRHRDMSPYYEHINSGGKLFPVKLRYKDGRMTVEAWSPQVVPDCVGVGDVVLGVNGEPVESLVARYARYLSLETDLQRRWAMEWWFDKYQVLLGDTSDRYELRMRDAQGHVYEETLAAAAPWLQQYEDLKRRGPAFHYEFYHGGRTCLFRLRNFNANARKDLDRCVLSLLKAMREKETQYLILDLRGNGGGNSGLGMALLRLLIDKPYANDLKPREDIGWPVKLALLCDRSTYSAASWLAMVVKDCNVGVIAGEETGGRASFFGDIVHVSLPHTGLSCGIGTKFFMRRAGYDDRRGVLPDLPLDVTLPDARLADDIHRFMQEREAGTD